MNNYMMYSGTEGVYTHTTKYARDPACSTSGGGTAVVVTDSMTLQQVLPPPLLCDNDCRFVAQGSLCSTLLPLLPSHTHGIRML